MLRSTPTTSSPTATRRSGVMTRVCRAGGRRAVTRGRVGRARGRGTGQTAGMRLYATSPVRRTRQVVADLFVLLWVVGWALVGRWVHALVMTLAAPAEPLRDAGTSLSSRMRDIADRIGEVPLVGEGLDAPFDGTAAVG